MASTLFFILFKRIIINLFIIPWIIAHVVFSIDTGNQDHRMLHEHQLIDESRH